MSSKHDHFVALYRKYRPQTFAEVVGQEQAVTVLSAAAKSGAIAHAHLFSGGRGIGKTSIARILAHEIGVSDKDLYEIDAASNRGIDDIRDLREGVQTMPFESPYKVYIIDEVHMLTKEAFNALLKTLEEPPEHVIFMLATTEVDRLPDTIRSRCQTHVLVEPTRATLVDLITSVGKKEGYTVELAAAELIAILAGGSFRDALGVLQKVLPTVKDKKVSVDAVEAVTGAPKGELVNSLLESIAKRSLEEALSSVRDAAESGIDILLLQTLLLDKLRAVLLLRFTTDMKKGFAEQFGKEDFALLEKLAHDKDAHISSVVLRALLQTYVDTPKAIIKQLPLEMALIEILEVGE